MFSILNLKMIVLLPYKNFVGWNLEIFTLSLFLRALGTIEKRRVELDRDFKSAESMEQTNKYATMNKDEFKKLILMGKSKSRYYLLFFYFEYPT